MAYSKRRISHKKELYYIFCIVAVLAILLISFLGPGGYRDLQKARLELQAQRTQVEDLKHNNSERKKNIEALRSNKKVLEKYMRGKGYAKKGEIVKQLPPEPDKLLE